MLATLVPIASMAEAGTLLLGRIRRVCSASDGTTPNSSTAPDLTFMNRNERSNSLVEKLGGGKRAVFDATAQNYNRIRPSRRFVDHPCPSQTGKQWRAEDITNQK